MTVRTPAKVITEFEGENQSDDTMEDNSNSNNNANSDADEAPDSNDEFGDDADDESGNDDDGNSGWADAFAKVLQQEKPKNKKYLVLSKAKKLADRKAKDKEDKSTFEISKNEGADDAEQRIAETDKKPSKEELEWAAIAKKEKNDKLQELRVVPSEMDVEREKSFKRIAQKGVVQLFNAVRAQHRDLVEQLEKAGPLDHKRDAVLNNINKRKFLDMLMGSKRSKSENVDSPVKTEETIDEPTANKPSQWSVLRDDFMTNKKTSSHWDNDDDNDDDDDDDDDANGINDC